MIQPVLNLYLPCLLLLLAANAVASTGISTLTLTEGEGNYGLVDVVVNAPGAVDSDQTTLTGNFTVELEIDTDNDTVTGLTALSGDISGTQISFSGSTLLFGYDVTSSDVIGGNIVTTSPPGSVDPSTGNYDASEHPFQINSGTLSGNSRVLFTTSPLNVDFATNPFGTSNSGIGNVQITLLSSDAVSKTYSVVLLYPIDTTTPLDAGGTTIDVDIDGEVKALGTVTVPLLSDFELWLLENSLSGAFFDDVNQFGLPLGMQWALGLTAEAPPQAHLPKLDAVLETTTEYTIQLPTAGTAAELEVLYTTDLGQPFTSIDTTAVSVGNPIPTSTTGVVTITLLSTQQGFIKLSVTEP